GKRAAIERDDVEARNVAFLVLGSDDLKRDLARLLHAPTSGWANGELPATREHELGRERWLRHDVDDAHALGILARRVARADRDHFDLTCTRDGRREILAAPEAEKDVDARGEVILLLAHRDLFDHAARRLEHLRARSLELAKALLLAGVVADRLDEAAMDRDLAVLPTEHDRVLALLDDRPLDDVAVLHEDAAREQRLGPDRGAHPSGRHHDARAHPPFEKLGLTHRQPPRNPA